MRNGKLSKSLKRTRKKKQAPPQGLFIDLKESPLPLSKASLKAAVVAHLLLKDLGVEIKWTDSTEVPFMSYMGRLWSGENINTLHINRKMFQRADAKIDQNVQQYIYGLFHEAGHAIWAQCWGSVSGSNTDLVQEVWCDNFASDMCRKLGLKWAASHPSPYLHNLSQILFKFV